jgi:oligoribonuclease
MNDDKNLIWVDLEMSSLDVTKGHILEMACIITDDELNIIGEAPDLVIHQPDTVLEAMDDWCIEHHGKSGLIREVKESSITTKQAEQIMLDFVRKYTPPAKCPLAGNTVYVDKKFLEKYMPRFVAHLHYRIVDVSSLKELCRRWYPDIFVSYPLKKASHRSLADIKESIEELKYYRQHIFVPRHRK